MGNRGAELSRGLAGTCRRQTLLASWQMIRDRIGPLRYLRCATKCLADVMRGRYCASVVTLAE